VFRPSRLHGLVERIPQEMVTGLWFDRDEPIQMLALQHGLQLVGIDSLGTLDNQLRLGGYMSPRFRAMGLPPIVSRRVATGLAVCPAGAYS
jgi:hypothetical protein